MDKFEYYQYLRENPEDGPLIKMKDTFIKNLKMMFKKE